MADAVATQILVDGLRNSVIKFTNISDGTGESGVTKVDVSALVGSPDEVRIAKMEYATHGLGIQVKWDATTPVLACTIPQDETGLRDFRHFGGLINNAGAGKTGDITFTTTESPLSGDGYSVVLHLTKKYA